MINGFFKGVFHVYRHNTLMHIETFAFESFDNNFPSRWRTTISQEFVESRGEILFLDLEEIKNTKLSDSFYFEIVGEIQIDYLLDNDTPDIEINFPSYKINFLSESAALQLQEILN